MTVAYAVDVNSDYALRVGVAIAAVREYLDLTQEQLAAAANVSTSTISRYENGESAAQAHTMLMIARALGVPLELLMDPPPSRQAVYEWMAFRSAAARAPEPEPS